MGRGEAYTVAARLLKPSKVERVRLSVVSTRYSLHIDPPVAANVGVAGSSPRRPTRYQCAEAGHAGRLVVRWNLSVRETALRSVVTDLPTAVSDSVLTTEADAIS